LKKIFGLNKTQTNQNVIKNDNIIEEFKNTENNIKFYHRILAKIYFYYGKIISGKSLAAWAKNNL